jgi:hypothetical protein
MQFLNERTTLAACWHMLSCEVRAKPLRMQEGRGAVLGFPGFFYSMFWLFSYVCLPALYQKYSTGTMPVTAIATTHTPKMADLLHVEDVFIIRFTILQIIPCQTELLHCCKEHTRI